ncbi:class I SAM-dependent methyltransferase [Patescibacteria group bacterium]|nr:class I SAM-dependent methyltransferase [Patescibacteria group bacterium]
MPLSPTQAYYEKNAIQWEKRHTDPFFSEKQFTLWSKLLPSKAQIIDIGCAAGIHVPLFLGIGKHLTYQGIDTCRAFLKTAIRRYPHLPFSYGDITDSSTLPQKKFSGFWASSVFMHVPTEDWPRLGTTINHLMQPGAVGYLCLPEGHPGGGSTETDQRHFTIFDPPEERAMIKSFGWKIVKKGVLDGTSSKRIWRWYIVELP